MADGWVVNASPLIVLAKVGHVDLLSSQNHDYRIHETIVRDALAQTVGEIW